ncbi:hypothetical protein GCM10009863_40200 [Streptomyces axinellae]|uniref:Uncharacterized protein n=1 Tax=Streptomyces axinellae TaxID=552788 RepID=A0ABN3QBL5_9ACTN
MGVLKLRNSLAGNTPAGTWGTRHTRLYHPARFESAYCWARVPSERVTALQQGG